MHLGDAEYDRLDRIDLPAGDGLERHDDLRLDHHRVDALMRAGGVAAIALDGDLEDVAAGHLRPVTHLIAADRQAWPVVDAVNRAHREASQTHLPPHNPLDRPCYTG